jgi:hypothetical protein
VEHSKSVDFLPETFNAIVCREVCGACCIAPSISQAIPGMPNGKPAGVACVNLNQDYSCGLFGKADRPALCDSFQAEQSVCGNNREQALHLIAVLELATDS